jgi:hypothetical protein
LELQCEFQKTGEQEVSERERERERERDAFGFSVFRVWSSNVKYEKWGAVS